jgi:hypothetical protein
MKMDMVNEYCVGLSKVSEASNEKVLIHEQTQLIPSNTHITL